MVTPRQKFKKRWKKKTNKASNDEESARGTVILPNVPGFTSQFNRITKRDGFKAAKKTEK